MVVRLIGYKCLDDEYIRIDCNWLLDPRFGLVWSWVVINSEWASELHRIAHGQLRNNELVQYNIEFNSPCVSEQV